MSIKQNVDNSAHRPPKAGVLQNVKVLFSAKETAGPFGPHLMAEWGADVIWIETTKGGGDTNRNYLQSEHEHRNDRSLSLDIFSEEGMEIFKKLIKEVDIFLVGGKGPSFIRRGITDEFLWEINPKLVITRLSGYGQEGDPNYINRACYDGIAQAFSGFMSQNGEPGREPLPAYPYVGDYYTAVFGTAATLAALIRAKETGKGESIDLAMYEVLVRMETYNLINYLNQGVLYDKPGNRDPIQQAVGVYKTKDGYILMNILGREQIKKFMFDIGAGDIYGTEGYPETMSFIPTSSPKVKEIDTLIDTYMLSKTSAEHEAIFLDMKVACSPILTFADLPDHPHYKEREIFVEWETMQGETYKGTNIAPKFKVNKPKIWRAMPKRGYDNDCILGDLGYSEKEIEKLYENGVVVKS